MARASEYSFPWDAEETQPGIFDREYLADEFAEYFRQFITSGLFMKDEKSLKVESNGDMSVTLNPGAMIMEGYRYKNKERFSLPIKNADGVLDRIDRISITWSAADREISCIVLEGTPSANPIPRQIRRTEEYRDYVVADIRVRAGIISIAEKDITDTRLDQEVCGLAFPFYELDTTGIYAQLEAATETYMNMSEEAYENFVNTMTAYTAQEKQDFETWLATIKDVLDADAAGHLQLEIEELQRRNTALGKKEMFDFFGIHGMTTVFNTDGSITETDEDNQKKTTVFNADGSITERLEDGGGITLATKTTVFNADGSIVATVE